MKFQVVSGGEVLLVGGAGLRGISPLIIPEQSDQSFHQSSGSLSHTKFGGKKNLFARTQTYFCPLDGAKFLMSGLQI